MTNELHIHEMNIITLSVTPWHFCDCSFSRQLISGDSFNFFHQTEMLGYD